MKKRYIIIGLIAVILIAAVVIAFLLMPKNVNTTMRAMLISEDGSHAKMTSVNLTGKMTRNLFGEEERVFDGDVTIEIEPFAGGAGPYHFSVAFPRGNINANISADAVLAGAQDVKSVIYVNDDVTSFVLKMEGPETYYLTAPSMMWSEINRVFSNLGVWNPYIE